MAAAGKHGRRAYHHGDLRRAVLEAAVAEVELRGPSQVSIREIARRAGVSHAAPGRRSGRERTTPVMYVRDGRNLVISSESFGQQRPAAWPLNLEATPVATVRIGRSVVTCRALRLTEEEAERHWPALVAAWPAHATYLRRSGTRRMFLLVPETITDSLQAATLALDADELDAITAAVT